MEGRGQLHVPATSLPGERIPVTHQTGGWVASRTGLDAMKRDKESLWLVLGKRPARSLVTAHTELSHFHKSTHVYSNIESSERFDEAVCSESYLRAI